MITLMVQAPRREKWLVLLGILMITTLSWVYLVNPVSPGPESMVPWNGGLLGITMVMWVVMMSAMMLPTAAPMVLWFTRFQHRRHLPARAQGLTWLFVAGYLLTWTAYSLVLALAQWGLHGLGLMTAAMGRTDPLLGGVVLMVAGAFQWSGFKNACLSKCRSPLDFLLNHWRDGERGALIMGLNHGAYCVGCCWVLMLLMFVGGVMNLAWMGAIAVYVLLEKLVPGIRQLEQVTGWLLMASGLALTASSIYPSIG